MIAVAVGGEAAKSNSVDMVVNNKFALLAHN